MEASKCPKCGEEPHFVDAVEKWYCYGCNEYVEYGEVEDAKVDQRAPSAEPHDHPNGEIRLCEKCGAELEQVSDGKLFCYICESYPDESTVKPEAGPKKDEAQALLDSIPSPVISQEKAVPVIAPATAPEPQVEKTSDIKMCPACGQPMKWVEKYQRHYCYGCRKYAPRDAPEQKREPVPAKSGQDRKSCPECKGELKFIEKYNEYYCYACKKYPLRAKRSAPVEQKTDVCPKCGKPLTHVAKYGRDYCYSCKEYAPKWGGASAHVTKICPSCNSEMKFVSEYNEWYCFKCKKYSLRPAKPVLLF